ncbi:MAG: hypothetical protein JW768_15805 [Chitinispirillaceae bacterium]|nr:hypothetical protein [Chitinispirillaceae bacterium]
MKHEASRHHCNETTLLWALVSIMVHSVWALNPVPPIRLVDMHTAGIVQKGDFLLESRIYENYGVGFCASISAGITDRFCFGLGYGSEGLVGRSREVHYNPFPGCMVKYRLVEENYFLPGVALGFDYQGFGGMGDGIEDGRRFGYYGYIYKSPGFFAALSKSYLFLRIIELGLHGDLNLSLEEIGRVKWPDAWVGMDMSISDRFAFVAEYDLGLNTRDPHGSRNPYASPFDGYFNVGFRFYCTPELSLEFDMRDVLENRTYLIPRGATTEEVSVGWSREIKVTYSAAIR